MTVTFERPKIMTARSTLAKQAAADAESTKAPAKTTARRTTRKTPAASKVAGSLDLTTGELKLDGKPAPAAKRVTTRKSTPAKKAAPAKRTAKKTASVPQHVKDQAAEVKSMKAAGPAKTAKKTSEKREPLTFDSKDWTYLAEKDPSSLHVTLAKLIEQRADVEITPKQVQAVLAMHPLFQRSDHNKARPDYVGLAPEIVEQRSVHMVQAHKDAAEIMAAKVATAPAKKAPAKRAAKKTTAKKTA